MILDGGPTHAGLESTIVTLSPAPVLLRPGALAREEIEAVLGCRLQDFKEAKVRSPGELASHYAPRARYRLDAHHAGSERSTFGFSGQMRRRH